MIPGYTLRLKIGESEKAIVYLATSSHRGHNVALKVSKTLSEESAGRQFLEREYTAIMAVRSPLVVEIYDYGLHAGLEYLAMEYLPRGDLKARIQRGVSEQDALHYLVQIASALQVVHEAGIVHRDLKPPNVMLRENDGVALIDFGLARSLQGNTASTHTGVLLGSPYYMSPEQALGETLDARSDFYSLGDHLLRDAHREQALHRRTRRWRCCSSTSVRRVPPLPPELCALPVLPRPPAGQVPRRALCDRRRDHRGRRRPAQRRLGRGADQRRLVRARASARRWKPRPRASASTAQAAATPAPSQPIAAGPAPRPPVSAL